MQAFQDARPFDDNDLDRLEDLLAADVFGGEAMRLDELHGMMCALASAPEQLPPEVWIAEALGVEPDSAEHASVREAAELLLRFQRDVAAALDRGEEPELILYPLEEEGDEYDFGAWADGYLFGSQLGEIDWIEAAGEYADDLSGLLDDFFLLNGSLREDVLKHGEAWMSESAEQRALQRAADQLPESVLAIHEFWKALRAPAETMRRDAPKTGRNDPCPCGSGKKFKQCCGDPRKLH